jgi:hypothetical protein
LRIAERLWKQSGDRADRRHGERGARPGDIASASLSTSSRLFELDAHVWNINTVRVMARNISGATFDLAAAALSVGVTKRRVP